MTLASVQAEQSLLGALLLEPDRYHDIAGRVAAGDFAQPGHRLIFEAIRTLVEAGSPVDPVTVSQHLEAADQLADVGGLAYLGDLAHNTPSTANTAAYADIVREKAQRRRLRDLLTKAAQDAENADLDDLLAQVTSAAERVGTDGSGALSFSEAFSRALDYIDSAAEARARGGVVGVPTGLPAIDNRTGGLQPGRLIVLAARPSIGKTALANQIALHAAAKGHPVGILSLEMGAEELMTRALAHTYGLNVSRLSFGEDGELRRLTDAMRGRGIKDLPVWLDCDTYALGGIVARLSEWRRKHDIALGIVDHIGLIEGSEGASRNDWLGKISRTLKLTAKRLGIPLIAVSQLNRSVERDKRRPVLADLRDSGNIEQDADICMFLHVEHDAKESNQGLPIEIGLLKNRMGRRGWLPEHFTFDGRTQRFRELVTDASQYRSGFDRAAGG